MVIASEAVTHFAIQCLIALGILNNLKLEMVMDIEKIRELFEKAYNIPETLEFNGSSYAHKSGTGWAYVEKANLMLDIWRSCSILFEVDRDALHAQLETTKRELMATTISWQNALAELEMARGQEPVGYICKVAGYLDFEEWISGDTKDEIRENFYKKKEAHEIVDNCIANPERWSEPVFVYAAPVPAQQSPAAPVPAMPIPKQEPIGKICKSAECGGVDFYFDKIPDGETMLYAGPQPSQAAAMPESELIEKAKQNPTPIGNDECDCEKLQARIRHLERLLMGL